MARRQYPIKHLSSGKISQRNKNSQILWVNLNRKWKLRNVIHVSAVMPTFLSEFRFYLKYISETYCAKQLKFKKIKYLVWKVFNKHNYKILTNSLIIVVIIYYETFVICYLTLDFAVLICWIDLHCNNRLISCVWDDAAKWKVKFHAMISNSLDHIISRFLLVYCN